MSPSAMGRCNWRFAVVDNRHDLDRLADAKASGARLIRQAPLAIVVMGEPEANDCWVEDCSIAAISMQYQAADLGLGSCWVQMRGRGTGDGHMANEVIHGILGLPDNLEVLCVVAIGHPAEHLEPRDEDGLKWENVIVRTDD